MQLNTVFIAVFATLSLTARSAEISMSTNNFPTSQIYETWGWMSAHDADLAGIEISDAELDTFLKGVAINMKGGKSPDDLQIVSPDVDFLTTQRRQKMLETRKQDNITEASGFFSALKLNPRVKALPSGSGYEVLQEGEGPFPQPQETVNIHYTGRLIDGTEFTQGGPLDVILVTNHLNLALFEGIQKINAGGRLRVYVPPQIAALNAEQMGAPAGATLVFEVELFGVTNTSPQDLADALVPPAPALPPTPWSGRFTTRRVIEDWGWSVGNQIRIADLKLGSAERAEFLKGMRSGLKDESAPYEVKGIFAAVEQFIGDSRAAIRLAFERKQAEENAAFFAELKKNPAVVQMPDGLCYEIVKPGSGAYPTPDQVLTVNYTGRLLDGTIFDRTDPSLGPLEMRLDTVLRGWNEGLLKINKGGKIRLYVPPALGYGKNSVTHVPPDSTLIFEVEVLDIKDKLSNEQPTSAP